MPIVVVALKLLAWILILLIPLTGVWLASALAAFANGPIWLTIISGALLFPLLPIGWDAFARWRRARSRARARPGLFRDERRAAFEKLALRWSDRILVRTLILNVVFIGALLWKYPHDTFTAVAARGDWMLDGVEAAWADGARQRLYRAADWIRARLEAEQTNPFEAQLEASDAVEPPPPPPPPTPAQQPATAPKPAPVPLPEPVIPPWTPTLHVQDPYVVEQTLKNARKLTTAAQFADDATLEAKLLEAKILEPGHRLRWRYLDDQRADAHRLRPAAVGVDSIARVEIRAPYLRISLKPDAAATLCAATTAGEGYRLYALAQDRVQTWIEIHEPICEGVIAMPLDPTRQADDYDQGPEEGIRGATDHWPTPDRPHPLARTLPAAHEVSIQAVARYIKANEADPHQRFKALHDYVVTRVVYDLESLEPGKRRPQDADTVFRDRRGVCAGYANLLSALGREAGYEITNVSGRTRAEDGDLAGSYHAWNAVKIEDAWYLVDPTWNAGGPKDGVFAFNYQTTYLFTPPKVFSVDHLPGKDGWQLQAPISQGEFVRQPYLNPTFFRRGLQLISPTRSQVTVARDADIEIANPRGAQVTAVIARTGQECETSGDRRVRVHCRLPGSGNWQVVLYGGDRGARSLRSMGRVEFVVP